jgi:hypothetical protein
MLQIFENGSYQRRNNPEQTIELTDALEGAPVKNESGETINQMSAGNVSSFHGM